MKKPNVILVITDDQGYGDLGCTGNPWVQTPNIDAFSKESTRLNDFHVAPLCAPTRGGLMSGCNTLRNGVWGTCFGRSILKKEFKTLGNLFSENGYRTGLFGKWHLGDNFPYRPEDRGFDTVVAHKGGGVGQTPDFWGNNYFDDTYFANGKPTNFDGYCTDVWFDSAKKFINDCEEQPFFAYIATNAPHSPYLVDEKYAKKYREFADEIVSPEFYGMIENIDENFGDLRQFLSEKGIEDDTILIFMTDNGSSGAARLDSDAFVTKGYNGGLRGMKGSFYEGGHKVPFFIRWKNGNVLSADINDLVMHNDLFRTFATLCDLELNLDYELDGIDVSQTILNGEKVPERTEFAIYHQNTAYPPETHFAVLTQDYRLVRDELYAKSDKEQRHNIAKENPEVVEALLSAYKNHRESLMEEALNFARIPLGTQEENPTRLDAMDVLGDVAWSQEMVHAAAISSGEWVVSFVEEGEYEVTLCRWPQEVWDDIKENMPQTDYHLAAYHYGLRYTEFCDPQIKSAKLSVFDDVYEVPHVDNERATFTINIKEKGDCTLKAGFNTENGNYIGAYYVYVNKL